MCACVKPCRCTASVNWMAFCVITVFVSTREIARIPPVSPAKVNKPAPLRKKTDCIFPHVNMTNNSDVRFPKGICDLCVRSRIGKPRFWGKTQAGWKYDVSAGCRRDASWTCLEGQIAFVPRLIKSPVIIALQRMSGGGGMNEERFRCSIDLYECRRHSSHISQNHGVVGRPCNDHRDGCDLIRGVFFFRLVHKALLWGSLATERAGAQRVEGLFIILVAMQLSN